MTCHSPRSCASATCGSNISQGPLSGSASSSSCRDDDDEFDHSNLYEFWANLSPAARHDLLRLDKQSLFEQVRKNMYCSRCNGLLLEAFSQLVDYSKGVRDDSLWHYNQQIHRDMKGCCVKDGGVVSESEYDMRDPSGHPWGGLMVTRDNTLTFPDCFFEGRSMELVESAFGCARASERERELHYPDACGCGGGRGWMGTRPGRGHNPKETCALHTARPSCDALVDFWAVLSENTRRSLLRMKEEDFVARLNFRFDSKRFCRDCRRNVSRELKELKELKRCRKELRCTSWFCNADTAFTYEVSNASVQVNWREFLGGDIEGTYEHIEWGLGTTEGDSDILEYEDVGLSEGARVDGLDLEDFPFFYITLKAWKHDGKCIEVSVKAHGMKDRECVHRRLFIGDGYLKITEGESIRRFFEQAEEVEEEEEEEGTDKNGSEGENNGGRSRRHAKSPELARDFLLDAAIIIFKEQVEKAFRERIARQNARTMFVYLVTNLLEERIHVACKEISTLVKQQQLLEEEEHEKQEEMKRRERKKMKDKERKLRKKEKQRGRERGHVLRDEGQKKSHELSACNSCDSTATDMVEDNEESHSDDDMRATSSVQETIELCSSHGDSNIVDISVPVYNSRGDESQECSDDGFICGHLKGAKRRSKLRNGALAEIAPRRVIRRGRSASLDSSSSSSSFDLRTSLKSTCISSATETIRTVPNRKATLASAMVAVDLSSVKSLNDLREKSWQNPDRRQCCGKNEVREDNVSIESFEKNISIVSSSKGNFRVSGSLQCNQPNLNLSSSEEEQKQKQQKLRMGTCPTELNGNLSAASSGPSERSSCQEQCCGRSHGVCEKDVVEDDSPEPNSLKASRSSTMLSELKTISSEGSRGKDLSPSTRASFPAKTVCDEAMTVTSYGGSMNTNDGRNTGTCNGVVASFITRPESSSHVDFRATLVGANTTKILTSEQPCIEHANEEECKPLPLDDHVAFDGFPGYCPRTSNPSLLLNHAGIYDCNLVLDCGCRQDCLTECNSVMPPHSSGYSLISNSCAEAQFPHHPQGLGYECKSRAQTRAWPLPFDVMPQDPISTMFGNSNVSSYAWGGGHECSRWEECYCGAGPLLFRRDGFQQRYGNEQAPASCGTRGFSLFHFDTTTHRSAGSGKPLGMPSCGRYVQQEATVMSKSSPHHVEEYSLFAATPSNRFSFF